MLVFGAAVRAGTIAAWRGRVARFTLQRIHQAPDTEHDQHGCPYVLQELFSGHLLAEQGVYFISHFFTYECVLFCLISSWIITRLPLFANKLSTGWRYTGIFVWYTAK